MSKSNVKLAVGTGNHEVKGDVVNPGGWFGKAWIIGYPLGNYGFAVVVEGDTEQDAIDELADSKEYGYIININESELRGSRNEETVDRAGNDGHPVNLDNVTITRAPQTLLYFGCGIPDHGLTPKSYYDHINQ